MISAEVMNTVTSLFGAAGPSTARDTACWHELYGRSARSMLVPDRSLSVQRKCIRMFRPQWHQALAGDLQLLRKRLPAQFANTRPFAGFGLPDAAWAHQLGLRGLCDAVIQVGTPGPYQKATIGFIAADGEPLAMAKIALGKSADATVSNEAQWLQRMERFEVLRGWMPRFVSDGTTKTGRRYLVTDVGPAGGAATSCLKPRHTQFLQHVGRASMKPFEFRASSSNQRLVDNLSLLEPHIPANARQFLRQVHRDCVEWLKGWVGPFTIAHGDFAPWNTLTPAGRLYVFDWECAWQGANPLYDLLHFLLMPRVLRRLLSAPGHRHMRGVVERAQRYAQETYPEWPWERATVSALALQYLLDLIVYYGVADSTIKFEHPVIANYWRLLEDRKLWMT